MSSRAKSRDLIFQMQNIDSTCRLKIHMSTIKQRNTPLGAGLVVASSFVYASYGIWTKLLDAYFPEFMLAVLRSSLVVIFLLPFVIYKKQLTKIYFKRDSKLFIYLLISGLMVPAPFVYAVQEIGIGLSLAIVYAGIVIGALFFGKVMTNEIITKEKWVAVLFGFVGLYLVLAQTTEQFGFLGGAAALISGVGVGLNMVVNKKMPYSASQTTVQSWIATAVVNIPFAFITSEHVASSFKIENLFYLIVFSIASLIASYLVIKGLKMIDAGVASLLGLLEIIFGVFFGVVFYDERLKFIVLVGMSLILMAAAIPYLEHYINKNPQELD